MPRLPETPLAALSRGIATSNVKQPILGGKWVAGFQGEMFVMPHIGMRLERKPKNKRAGLAPCSFGFQMMRSA